MFSKNSNVGDDDDESKDDDTNQYEAGYILSRLHFCTKNTGYKANKAVIMLKEIQGSKPKTVYLEFENIEYMKKFFNILGFQISAYFANPS